MPKLSVIIPTMNRYPEILECINSVLACSYPDFEVIVVDNGSTDGTYQNLKKIFSGNERVIIFHSKKNLGAGGGRNKGAALASGELFFFVDDDNVLNKQTLETLVRSMVSHEECGLSAPLMLYKERPDLIWLYFADINMYTSKAFYRGTNEKASGSHPSMVEVGHLPNCFMVWANDFRSVGGFDEKYVIMYEEADFAEKIKRKLSKKICLFTKPLIYHNIKLPETGQKEGELFRSKERAFLTARNRIYFMKRNANLLQLATFFIIFNPLFFLFYEAKLLAKRDFSKAFYYFKGVIAGLLM